MISKAIVYFCCVLVCAFGLPADVEAQAGRQVSTEEEAFQTGIQAYVFGYPLVLMEVTRDVFTHVPMPWRGRAPVNQFAHIWQFVNSSFKNVASPNVDVLFSAAWLDLSQEPVILHVPDTNDRYYIMPLLDAWTNVFYSIGKRTTGTKAADFVIIGPGWQGYLPQNIQVVKAPTNTVWIYGRIECKDASEYPAVNAIQRQFTITPLRFFGRPYVPPPYVPVIEQINVKTPPAEQVDQMDAQVFFNRLATALSKNPPAARDAPMVDMLSRLGVVRGLKFDINRLSPSTANGLNRSVNAAQASIDPNIVKRQSTVNGWIIYPSKEMGNYGTNYLLRAIVSKSGLGANLAQDTVYAFGRFDNNGIRLSGSYSYILHFDKDQIPPINAFWSVTMYDRKHQLVKNPGNLYGIRSNGKIVYNTDGSLDLLFQRQDPKDPNINWLPTPEGEFNLIMRMYWPKQPILDNTWNPPQIIRKKSEY